LRELPEVARGHDAKLWIDGELPPGKTKLNDGMREAAAQKGISDRVLRRAARRVAAKRRGVPARPI
jgi:hypothetical protein